MPPLSINRNPTIVKQKISNYTKMPSSWSRLTVTDLIGDGDKPTTNK